MHSAGILLRKWVCCLFLALLLGCGSDVQISPVPDILALSDQEVLSELFGKPDKEGRFYIRASALGLANLAPVGGGADQTYLATLWFRESFSMGNEQYHAAFVRLQLIDSETGAPLNNTNAVAALTYRKGDAGWLLVSYQKSPFTQMVLGEDVASIAEKREARMLNPEHLALLVPVTGSALQVLAFDGRSWADLGQLLTGGGNFELAASTTSGELPDIRVDRKTVDTGNAVEPARSVVYRVINGKYRALAESGK